MTLATLITRTAQARRMRKPKVKVVITINGKPRTI